MNRSKASGKAVAATVLIALVAACGVQAPSGSASTPSGSAQSPPGSATPSSLTSRTSFAVVDCPSDVASAAGSVVTCGYLTVPENRAKPDGRTIRLFVARRAPTGAHPAEPVLSINDLGYAYDFPEEGEDHPGPFADRWEAIQLDQRGTGRSEPSLECPEVESVADSSLTGNAADAKWLATLTGAVRQCRDRLAGQGIDLAAYDLAAIAADAEDLRIALGIESWYVRGVRAGARVAFEILRRYPTHVQAAWLDSPEIPQVDLLTGGIVGVRYGIEQIDAACQAHPVCDAPYPNVADAIAEAIARNGADPLEAHGLHAGSDIGVRWDDGLHLRALREGLAWYFDVIPWAHHSAEFDPGTQDSNWATDGPAFMLGYVVDASRAYRFSHGAFLSTICRDQLAFVHEDELRELAGGDRAYVEAYAESPFFELCRIWDVGASDQQVREPVVSDVPVLLLVGRFSPYGTRPMAEEAAKTLSRSWVIEVPDQGSNALAVVGGCPWSIRNAWLDHLPAAPDTSCLAEMPPVAWRMEGQ